MKKPPWKVRGKLILLDWSTVDYQYILFQHPLSPAMIIVVSLYIPVSESGQVTLYTIVFPHKLQGHWLEDMQDNIQEVAISQFLETQGSQIL